MTVIAAERSLSADKEDAGKGHHLKSLVEDMERTPEWHPFVKKLTSTHYTKEGRGSKLEWEGVVAGVNVRGSTEVTVWKPGKEYVWRHTEQSTGANVESRFAFDETGTLKASATLELPDQLEPMVNREEATRYLESAVDEALNNVQSASRRGAKS